MNPWMGTIILTLADTSYKLTALLALAAKPPNFGSIHSTGVAYLAIQADPSGAGAEFYIGREGLDGTNMGVLLFATQVWPIYSFPGNVIDLGSIYVRCNTAGLKMNVTFLKL